MTLSAVRAGPAAACGLTFALGAFRFRVLTRSGAAAGGLFAASLVLVGDLGLIVPGLAFFVLSSLLSVGGAVFIWLAAWPWVPAAFPFRLGVVVIGSGLAASFFDSLLGATVQGRRRWLDNDAVNLLTTTVGGTLAWTCF